MERNSPKCRFCTADTPCRFHRRDTTQNDAPHYDPWQFRSNRADNHRLLLLGLLTKADGKLTQAVPFSIVNPHVTIDAAPGWYRNQATRDLVTKRHWKWTKIAALKFNERLTAAQIAERLQIARRSVENIVATLTRRARKVCPELSD